MKLLRKTTSKSRINRKGFFYKRDYKKGDWPSEPTKEYYGEIQLHRRVLDATLSDYLSKNEQLKKEAEEWLCLDDPDFQDVCEFAEIDPEIVFNIFLYFREHL